MGQQRPQRYLVALGSNQRHRHYGGPRAVITAALAELAAAGLRLVAVAPTITSAPLGPSLRRYANTAAIVETTLAPEALLRELQAIEHRFGRRSRGQRWSARVLDLDIVLWSGGRWQVRTLTIPHPAFRARDFVLIPAAGIARGWRDPLTGLTLAHLVARLTRRRAAPRSPSAPAPARAAAKGPLAQSVEQLTFNQ